MSPIAIDSKAIPALGTEAESVCVGSENQCIYTQPPWRRI
jgi:hypothetical protein